MKMLSKTFTLSYKLNQSVYQTFDPANYAYINLEGNFTVNKYNFIHFYIINNKILYPPLRGVKLIIYIFYIIIF